LLKHDYIQHKIQPISGYSDLEETAQKLVAPMMQNQGGSGGVVVCLGVGGMADLGSLLGLEQENSAFSGVEVWVLDAHRPWNLANVVGGYPIDPAAEHESRFPPGADGGRVERAYKPGKGGIVVFDDGDIEEGLQAESDAYLTLLDMPEVEDDDEDLGETEDELDEEEEIASVHAGKKRKSWSDRGEDESSDDEDRPRQRRRSNSVSPSRHCRHCTLNKLVEV
jgi:cell division control protein 45